MRTQNGQLKREIKGNHNSGMDLCVFHRGLRPFGVVVVWLTILASLSSPAAFANSGEIGKSTNGLCPSWPGNLVDGLLNLDFSDHHLTPRGINLQEEGLIAQPYLRLNWKIYDAPTNTSDVLSKISLTTAVWNDVDTVASGVNSGNWNEVDFIAGPNVTLWKNWTVESPFIGYKSETGSFPMCWAWNPKLTYHDHFLGQFSINPYAEFFVELANKITVVLAPASSQRSYYGVIGITPTYIFEPFPLKLELPTYLLIPGEQFYQKRDGSGGGTDLGLFATTFKATVPLDFINASLGQWSVYAACQFDYLNNPGLLDGNWVAGAGHSRERDILVLHGGVTVRF